MVKKKTKQANGDDGQACSQTVLNLLDQDIVGGENWGRGRGGGVFELFWSCESVV